MIEETLKDAADRMQKSIGSLSQEFAKIRTGRAHTSLLDHIMVDYYGTDTPLNQVANVGIEDARTLSVTPWEDSMVEKVEKAIMNADLGLNPSSAGKMIRVPMPMLTEERRKELVKVVRGETENGRIAVRNIRRDAIGDLKDLEKAKEISEDDLRKAETRVQGITDEAIAEIEKHLEAKEKELMEV